jgi:uncharacterized protein (DUF3820 family)
MARTMSTTYAFTMPFGQYKGWKITDVPIDYLGWMIRNLDFSRREHLRLEIEDEIRRRAGKPPHDRTSDSRQQSHSRSGTQSTSTSQTTDHASFAAGFKSGKSAIERVYKKMCYTHHPDRGGNTEAMKAINTFHDAIIEELDRW